MYYFGGIKIKTKIMKILLITLISIIHLYTSSQVTLEGGYMDSNDSLVFETYEELEESFRFVVSEDKEYVTCFIFDSNKKVKSLMLRWTIVEILLGPDIDTYIVTDVDDHYCYLSFFTNKSQVFILDLDDNNKFSSLKGSVEYVN